MRDYEWDQERKWLNIVLKEAQKQLEKSIASHREVKSEAVALQRELWREVGVITVTDGLEKLADFMGYIDTMKIKKRNLGRIDSQRQKFERMCSSPYFGRIDFAEDGEARAEKYYIGVSALSEDNLNILICDWRAPISSMFYDFETGRAEFQTESGRIRGELTLKRQYKIEGGKLIYCFDSSLKIDDEILQQALAGSADGRMRAIVTTIQREQNRAIRNEEFKNLIVSGPAGSGKTSVALHRAAYLLYQHRDTIGPENIVIFSPNRIFNEYISGVLPQLGEENILQLTFADYMRRALGGKHRLEGYYEMTEFLLTARNRPTCADRIGNIKYKTSAAFFDLLKGYAAKIAREGGDFPDIVHQDRVIASSGELKQLYEKDYALLPHKARLRRIKDRLLALVKPMRKARLLEAAREIGEEIVFIDRSELKQRSLDIVNGEMQALYALIERATECDPAKLYRKLFETPGLLPEDGGAEGIRSYTLENLDAGQIFYEDQPPLLYLKIALGDLPDTSGIKYVIVDEGQDYTALQYEILGQLFRRAGMTVLGDPDQAINPYMNLGDMADAARAFPPEDTRVLKLSRSYRSTVEITRFTRRLLSEDTPFEPVERHGEEPLVEGLPDEEAIIKRILGDIKIFKREGLRSIGVITRTRRQARRVFAFLKKDTEVSAILGEEDAYAQGAVVIPAYLAKGLEFDAAILFNAGGENYNRQEERLLFYTACTRALHALHVYYCGARTPLLGECPDRDAGA